MKGFTLISALVGAAFVGLTSAQGISSCILTCSTQAANMAGCGSITNTTCICTSATFQNDAGACLLANCTTADQQSASALQSAQCGTLSVTSGTVTATVASATGSTTINSAALSSSAASGASAASMSASSVASVAASGASAVSASASSAAGAASSLASAAASKAAAGQAALVGFKGLIGVGVGVLGAVAGAVMVL